MPNEIMILDMIQSYLKSPFLDTAMPFITSFGNNGIFWIIVAVALLSYKKTRKIGIIMAAGLLIEGVLCNLLLKPIVARTRPYDINTAVELLISKPKDFSFPSGHTGISFAATTALFFSKTKLWLPAFLLAILIGFSRLYLYVHFPSDVIVGAVLGVLSGYIGNILVKKYILRKEDIKYGE